MWLIRLRKIDKPKIFQIFPPFCVLNYSENYPLEFFPQENCPLGKLPPVKSPPHLQIMQMKDKNKIRKVFTLKKAVQYNMLIKITKVLFDTQMISQKIRGLDTFFTEWKKSKNRPKAKIVKWHLLASCKSQGELKQGSQIIKFGKMWKY